jgi:hypothetical protein
MIDVSELADAVIGHKRVWRTNPGGFTGDASAYYLADIKFKDLIAILKENSDFCPNTPDELLAEMETYLEKFKLSKEVPVYYKNSESDKKSHGTDYLEKFIDNVLVREATLAAINVVRNHYRI